MRGPLSDGDIVCRSASGAPTTPRNSFNPPAEARRRIGSLTLSTSFHSAEIIPHCFHSSRLYLYPYQPTISFCGLTEHSISIICLFERPMPRTPRSHSAFLFTQYHKSPRRFARGHIKRRGKRNTKCQVVEKNLIIEARGRIGGHLCNAMR